MNVFRRLAIAGAGCAAAIAAVVPLWQAPALADPSGLVTKGFTTAATSSDKSFSLDCPDGTVVTGGGGYLTANPPAMGWVGLDRLEPRADGTGFTATMREVDNYAGNWSLTVKAQCADLLPGWQRLEATSLPATTTATATTPECGTGKSVIGTGARVNNGQGEVVLDDLIPSATLKTVTAKAYRIPGSSHDAWTVTAYAICANTPAGLELVSFNFGPLTSTTHRGGNWNCPDDITPKGLLSGGFEIAVGNGNVLPTLFNMVDTDGAAFGAHEYHSGYGGNWSATLYLICAS